MHEIYELKEMLCEELEKYGAKGDLSAGELEIVDKLAHTVKNLCKIVEAYEEEEYSNAMGGISYQRGGGQGGNRGGNRGGGNRGGGNSNARGRNTRRNNMGRYSREGYSYEDGMDDLLSEMRSIMGELPEEKRREVERFVNKMERM